MIDNLCLMMANSRRFYLIKSLGLVLVNTIVLVMVPQSPATTIAEAKTDSALPLWYLLEHNWGNWSDISVQDGEPNDKHLFLAIEAVKDELKHRMDKYLLPGYLYYDTKLLSAKVQISG